MPCKTKQTTDLGQPPLPPPPPPPAPIVQVEKLQQSVLPSDMPQLNDRNETQTQISNLSSAAWMCRCGILQIVWALRTWVGNLGCSSS